MSYRMPLALTALWVALTGEPTLANVALGLVVGVAITWLVGPQPRPDREPPKGAGAAALRRGVAALILAATFLWELTLSSVRMGVHVLRPRGAWREGIVAVRIEPRSESELAALSALITLTPGTLTVDVAADQRTLYVHVMSKRDPDVVRSELEAGVVRHVRRLFA